MKLFTQEIDRKLFSQYNLGSDLSKQMVVAKIFNPYGAGRWFLVNSDPQDPDYLWAIVDLFDVEVGSVSRTELESIRIGKHGLPLERDLYFKPINAEELLNGLMQGNYYKKGGLVNNQNKEMLQNQAKEFTHHSKELNSLVGKTKEVDAWVVAKAERATTDLSDITHYLDGRMEDGGSLEKMFEEMQNQNTNIRLKVISVVGINQAHNIINQDLVVNPFTLIEGAVRKGFITIDEIDRNIVNSAVQEAYDIDSSYRDSGQGISGSDMNAFISSMLNGAGIKVGVVNDTYTRLANGGLLETYKGHDIEESDNVIEVVSPSGSRFIIGLDDSKMSGRRKSIEMTRAEGIKSAREYIDWKLGVEKKQGTMKMGGLMKDWTIAEEIIGGEKHYFLYNQESGKRKGMYKSKEEAIKEQKSLNAMMAKGGMVVTSIKDIPNFKKRYAEDKVTYRGLGLGKKYDDFYDIAGENGVSIKVDGKEYNVTMTEFNKYWKDKSGRVRIRFVAPYRRHHEKGGIMERGGKTYNQLLEDFNVDDLDDYESMMFKRMTDKGMSKEKALEILINQVEGDYSQLSPKLARVAKKQGTMEMGGATFKEKVNAISKRLEGTKVPTRLKKDYGATYDKKEAKQAGQRIAGSMIKKLKMRKK